MFPKHTKSIFVMILVLRSCICTISITHFVSGVESHFCVCGRFYPAQQLCFGPTIPFHSLDVPCLILQRQIRFQNNHILRPADLHGLQRCFNHRQTGAGEVLVINPPHDLGFFRNNLRFPVCAALVGVQFFVLDNGFAVPHSVVRLL